MLLIPDLLNFWLTGQRFAERTNASTTGLLRVSTRLPTASSTSATGWDDALIERLCLPCALFPELLQAGSRVGRLLPHVAAEIGVSSTRTLNVVAVGFDDLAWITEQWPGKAVVKGVQNLDDAKKLVDLGVDGITLSNHGSSTGRRYRSTCYPRWARTLRSTSTPGSCREPTSSHPSPWAPG